MDQISNEKLLSGARNLKSKGYSPQEVDTWLKTKGSSLSDMKNYVSTQKENEDRQIQRRADAQLPPKTFVDKWADVLATNPAARAFGLGYQGISNSTFNPFGYAARALGMDTKPLQAENGLERGIEKGAEYGNDAAWLALGGGAAKGAGLLGQGVSKTSQLARAFLAPAMGEATAGGIGGGVVEGIADPKSFTGRILANLAGSMVGGGIYGAFRPVKTQTVQSGLKNALTDDKAMQTLYRGIKENNDVARSVKSKSVGVLSDLNDEAASILEKIPGHRLDINKANTNQLQRFKDYIGQNAEKEIIDFTPDLAGMTPKEIKAYKLNHASAYNSILKSIVRNETKNNPLFQFALKDGKRDYEHFLKDRYRRHYIHSMKDTLHSPDMVGTDVDGTVIKKYLLKKYRDKELAQDIWDFIIQKDGTVVSKYARAGKSGEKSAENLIKRGTWQASTYPKTPLAQTENASSQYALRGLNITQNEGSVNRNLSNAHYLSNQLKNAAQDASLNGRVIGSAEPTRGKSGTFRGTWQASTYPKTPLAQTENASSQYALPKLNITQNGGSVNNNLPNIHFMKEGLTDFQKEALDSAIAKGKFMSNEKLGSLGATHKAQEVLNDMIEASYDTSVLGAKRPTTETKALMEVKNKLNAVLEAGGIKPYDRSLSKAKSLRDFYEKGYKFKPSEVKYDLLGLKNLRDKQAFYQGLSDKILDNVTNSKSVAKGIEENINVFKKLLPEEKVNTLMKRTSQNKEAFERMLKMAGRAENKTTTPRPKDRPKSETWESITSLLGSGVDKIQDALYRRKYVQDAHAILNGKGEIVDVNKYPFSIGKIVNMAAGAGKGLANEAKLLYLQNKVKSISDMLGNK